VRGFSERKTDVNKLATNFDLAKTNNFLYILLLAVLFRLLNIFHTFFFRRKKKTVNSFHAYGLFLNALSINP
jgi:hypothetical protein